MARVRFRIGGLSNRAGSTNSWARLINTSALSKTNALIATTFIGASVYTSVRPEPENITRHLLHHEFSSSDHDWSLVSTDSGSSSHESTTGCLKFDDSYIVLGELDLVFVIDTSGSMVGTPLQNAKKEIQKITESITDKMLWGIQVGVVGAARKGGQQSLQVHPLSSDVESQMDQASELLLTESGGDNQLSGVDKALELLADSSNHSSAQVIVLITDAGFNGKTEEQLAATREACDEVHLCVVLDQTDETAIAKRRAQARKLVKNDGDVGGYGEGIENLVTTIIQQVERARELKHLGRWNAPPEVVQTIKKCHIGDQISFRLRRLAAIGPSPDPNANNFFAMDLIRLASDQTEIFAGTTLGSFGAGDWHEMDFALSEETAWINASSQQPASKDEIAQVLRSLKSVQVRCDYQLGPDTTFLDDFQVIQPATTSTTK